MTSFNPYNEKSEKELATLIAEGNEKAFKALYLRLLPRLVSSGRNILKSEERIAEVIQEVLIRVWIHREKLREIESPRAWVYRIFCNECFRYLKKNGLQLVPLDNIADNYTTNVSNSTEQACFLRETHKIIHQAVKSLSPRQREIYTLSREQGLKISEIAVKLGLSSKYVRKTLSVALHHIRLDLMKFDQTCLFICILLVVFE